MKAPREKRVLHLANLMLVALKAEGEARCYSANMTDDEVELARASALEARIVLLRRGAA